MKMCQKHWDMCRKAIDDNGLTPLVPTDAETAFEKMIAPLEGTKPEDAFDPLMSMNWHYSNIALENGGLYLMTQTEDGSNDGHYCPMCEIEKHTTGFSCEESTDSVAKQMATWAREKELLPKVQ